MKKESKLEFTPEEKAVFARAGRYGGTQTAKKYGKEYMREIASRGGRKKGENHKKKTNK